MKSKRTYGLMGCRICLVVAVILVVVDNVNAIRVYEGTNFSAPPHKSQKISGFSKKSLYISKRSWGSGDEKLAKGYGDGKRKDIAKRTGTEEAPSLYKIKFTDKNYMQYLKYIKEIPRMEEYTFCLWYKSQNLTHDQTLFTYSLSKNELLLRFWINAHDSTFRMAIRESPVYKVPAIIRENKWHHICQSWNGVLGEWQIFLDGKRIAAGVLSHYKGTYIPEGGEVTLGQELVGPSRRLNDGMDGEVFGFNLVDEAVPQDQGLFINSQYRPNMQVPPFKKLPPIKKTYQEIKAYITSLPSDPSEVRKKNEGFPPAGDTASAIKKQRDWYSVPAKRNRGNTRLRYPPLRKVVVYNREDRQLPLEEVSIELNKTKPVVVTKTEVAGDKTPQVDVNYSIHSYRSGKDEKKTNNYEIYEVFEEDAVKTASEDELTNAQALERKARQNFNLFTARQANKVYTLSSSVKDSKKPKFHFETRTEKPEADEQRSSVAGEPRKVEEATSKAADSIPVYEIEIGSERRRRRSADGVRQSRQFTTVADDSNGFRRLPQIPDTFINIFTQNASRSEIEEKLEQFFPKNTTEDTNVFSEVTEPPKTSPIAEEEEEEEVVISLRAKNNAQTQGFTTESPIPSFSPMPAHIQSRQSLPEVQEKQPLYPTRVGPVNFPTVQDFNPKTTTEETRTPGRYNKTPQVSQTMMDRFDVSSGTDLVMRSYGECTSDRGSPVRDKARLVLSWADTPVRIFGGAQVEGARNQCGYF